jgi:hypothetical protein
MQVSWASRPWHVFDPLSYPPALEISAKYNRSPIRFRVSARSELTMGETPMIPNAIEIDQNPQRTVLAIAEIH